ncbi:MULTISPECIES: FAD-binding oxidoreductase [unclassified Streptomyces]|uniref:FAD-binding oxidoreductase n=1 Tax=unclassified Streptomyces TaxID=2593676 RepID=UPI002E21928C|nr:FAD-binding oxidoreductase [Streptomyces sp. NBC_01023]
MSGERDGDAVRDAQAGRADHAATGRTTGGRTAAGPPSAEALSELRAIDHGLLVPGDDLARYEESPNGLRGQAAFVTRPTSPDAVGRVLDWAHRNRVSLVPQGANSGLVGAAVPDGCGVLTTERLRTRFELDTAARTLVVDAGFHLSEINERLAPHGLHLPIEVGSDPMVGGMVSSNTAGSYTIGYGDVRRRVLGVQAALPDGNGTLIDLLGPLRKRNEGLDLRHMFIGTGGSFGVVTAASFDLAPLPRSRAAAWLAVPDERRIPAIVALFDADALVACEWLAPPVAELLGTHRPDLLQRLPAGDDHRVLVEYATADEHAERRLVTALAELAERGWVTDATVGPPDRMWEARHAVPEITHRMHPMLRFDISVSRTGISALRTGLTARLTEQWPGIKPLELGHYGDGGLHLLLPVPAKTDTAAVTRTVLDTVVREHHGSFSAEHGIGPNNLDAYLTYVPEPVRAAAKALKQHFDPHGVLRSTA